MNTLRTELNKQNLRVNEAVAAQNSLQERVQSLQKEANEKDGLYHAKCKELSVAKIRGAPSGIGMYPSSFRLLTALLTSAYSNMNLGAFDTHR